MDQKLKIRVSLLNDNIGILTISGELTVFSQDFELLHKELNAYMKMGIYKFIVDMSEMNYIDSSGIGLLIRLATNASKNNSKIVAICEDVRILKILAISNIDKILNFVKSVDEGIKYYTSNNNNK